MSDISLRDGSLRFTVGMEATELIIRLIDEKKEIERLLFMSYRVSPAFEERLSTQARTVDDDILERSLKLARDRRIPLWSAVTSCYVEDLDTAVALFREALVHDKRTEREIEIRRDRMNFESLHSLMGGLPPDFALGISSRVELRDGRTAHIPMMDLKCEKSAKSIQTLRRVFHEIGRQNGVLLDSGRSYHYYGLDLLGERAWQTFMGRCLLLIPLVDTRYIAHRIIDGYCRLRVNASRTKPQTPTVVDVFSTEPRR